MIYPDLRVLLSLLMPGDNTQEASNLIREPEHVPLTLSIVHRLQVENALLRYLHGEDQQMAAIAKDGLLLWRQYLEQGAPVRARHLKPEEPLRRSVPAVRRKRLTLNVC